MTFNIYNSFRSCYSTQAAIATCKSTVLSGRKKRESTLTENQKPIVDLNGDMVDFRDLIKASRVKYFTFTEADTDLNKFRPIKTSLDPFNN